MAKALKQTSTRRKKNAIKTSENYYIHYNKFSSIIRLSGLRSVRETEFADILKKYRDYITVYYVEKELIRIDFIDKHPEKEIVLDNLNKLPEYYKLFFEKDDDNINSIIACTICGKLIEKTSNNKKYCNECRIKIEREKQKILMRKRREKM
jgi:hypothetical protein